MKSIVVKDIQDIMYDLKQTQSRLEQYITDADRGVPAGPPPPAAVPRRRSVPDTRASAAAASATAKLAT